MKKTLLAALFATMVGYTDAQTIEIATQVDTTATDTIATVEQNTQASKIDSLEQQVAALQAKETQRDKNDYDKAIWRRHKYFIIGFSSQKLNQGAEEGEQLKSQFAVNLNWGNTYYLHKKAIADVLKIGLDWSWINISFAKYKSGSGININTDYDNSKKDNDSQKDNKNDVELGVYQLEAGMSIGPSFNVAPFYHLGKGLQHLKANVYFHYTPSYSMLLESYKGENEVNHAFANFFNIGLDIAYKAISVGYEYRWGSAKYDVTDFENSKNSGEKIKMDTKTSTFFVRFNF